MTPPPAAQPQVPASTGSAFYNEEDVLTAWWDGLSSARRRQLTTLSPQDPLPRWAEIELWRAGVSCPLTLIDDRGRAVRRALPPPGFENLIGRRALAVDTAPELSQNSSTLSSKVLSTSPAAGAAA